MRALPFLLPLMIHIAHRHALTQISSQSAEFWFSWKFIHYNLLIVFSSNHISQPLYGGYSIYLLYPQIFKIKYLGQMLQLRKFIRSPFICVSLTFPQSSVLLDVFRLSVLYRSPYMAALPIIISLVVLKQ